MKLTLDPITAEAFAPFGELIPPAREPGRRNLIDELQNGRAGARARLSLQTLAPQALPFTATQMERHRHSTQTFVPVDCDSYLVLVAPHGPDGLPDPTGLRAFRVPGDTAVNYRPDTWHHGMVALGRIARFAVLTFVDGTAGDDEIVAFAERVVIGG